MRLVFLLLVAQSLPALFAQGWVAAPPGEAQAAEFALRRMAQPGRALFVTAHPDDEDGALISWLARGLGYEVGLLTLTRGEGGQNEIGEELGAALGVLRSRELEAAHRYDGARQFFARAFDFGYSFSVEESLATWDEEGLLRDIVRVYREFRPDFIITLPPGGGGGGQHHQASAQLAQRARVLAADPEWAAELGAPIDVAQGFYRSWEAIPAGQGIDFDLGVFDPLLGMSYAECGLRSRAQHKCQGMVRLSEPLAGQRSTLMPLWGPSELDPVATDFASSGYEGLVEGGVKKAVAAIAFRHRLQGGEAGIAVALPMLAELEAGDPSGLDASGRLRRERLIREVGRYFAAAAQLRVRLRVERVRVAPGRRIAATLAAWSKLPLRLSIEGAGVAKALELAGGRRETAELILRAPDEFHLETPVGMPRPDEAWTMPRWRDPGLRLSVVAEIEGRRVSLPGIYPEYELFDTLSQEIAYGDLRVVPDPSIRFEQSVLVLPGPPSKPRTAYASCEVSTTSTGDFVIRFDVPEGYVVSPRRSRVKLKTGQAIRLGLQLVIPPGSDVDADLLRARARRVGTPTSSRSGVRTIRHPHTRRGLLMEAAELRLRPVDLACSDRRVVYVPGTGDRIAEALQSLLPRVEIQGPRELWGEALEDVDVVVLGVRAYKDQDALFRAQPELLRWMADGGHLISFYNKLEMNEEPGGRRAFPFPGARVGRGRVTDETAPVELLVPDHPFFQSPNRLSAADWEGWVQERGHYFLEIDEGSPYRDLIRLEDPWSFNAGKKGGALVEAKVGKGRWTYVGLGLFRQLPAGVPGAWRLLANLVSAEID